MMDSQAASTSQGSPTLSRRREWLARLALLLGSLLLFLVCAEVALRLVAPPAEPHRGDADRDPFTFFDHHPSLGWDLVPGVQDRHKTPEFDVAIRISSEGLRSDRVYGGAPEPAVRRAVVLGDSFTFGHGVEVEEGWVARVESNSDSAGLGSLEMVNLAVTGYGVDQMVLRLEDRSHDGLAFSPDVVIAAVFLADVFRVADDSHIGYQKPRFVLDGASTDGLRLTGVPVPKQAAAHADRSTGSQLLRMTRERGVPLFRHLGWSDAWPITDALLHRLRRQVEEAGAQLVVVIIPKDIAVFGSGFRHELNRGAMDRLLAMLEAQNVQSLDLTNALTASAASHPGEALYFPGDGHWTAAGHKSAAAAVSTWLAKLWPAPSQDGTP